MIEPKVVDRLEKLLELTVRGDKHEAEVARARMNELVETFDIALEQATAARNDSDANIEREIVFVDRLIDRHQVVLVLATKLVELLIAKIEGDNDPLIATVEEQMQSAREAKAAIEEGLAWREKMLSGEFDPRRRSR